MVCQSIFSLRVKMPIVINRFFLYFESGDMQSLIVKNVGADFQSALSAIGAQVLCFEEGTGPAASQGS
jgi:hypothetical protein